MQILFFSFHLLFQSLNLIYSCFSVGPIPHPLPRTPILLAQPMGKGKHTAFILALNAAA